NEGIDPMSVTFGSAIKYYWKCHNCDLSFQVTPNKLAYSYGESNMGEHYYYCPDKCHVKNRAFLRKKFVATKLVIDKIEKQLTKGYSPVKKPLVLALVGPDNEVITQALKDALSTMPSNRSQIICSRLAIDADRTMTLQEIGDVLGITRERVRQLEFDAYKKLQKMANFVDVLNKCRKYEFPDLIRKKSITVQELLEVPAEVWDELDAIADSSSKLSQLLIYA